MHSIKVIFFLPPFSMIREELNHTSISRKERKMKSLQDKVAIITGGSRGIGRAVAKQMGAEGARVAVNFLGNAEAAHDVVKQIEISGGKAVAIQADASKVADIRRLFAESEAQLGKPDIVVLAPGAFVLKPLAAISEEEFDRVFALNTRGVFFALQEAVHRIKDGGSIISLSSGATASPNPNGSLYAGSKAAAEQFVSILARELGSRNISVNTVSPGLTNTDGMVLPPPMLEMMKQRIPFGRLAEPEEVASVITFLASPKGHWVTGQNVRANGGLV
jgi:3-oxoacyl-[acyl-carrier protein] reductase